MNCRPIFGIILIAGLTFTSCKKELEPQESTVTTTDTTAVAEAAAGAAAPTIQPNQPAPQQINPGQPMTVPAQQAPANVAKGMNPAHGQPGHRCEIPVGAPLNSAAPGKSAPVSITPQQAQPQVTQAAAPAILNPGTPATQTVTAPGMNPPHGQAGHRCDIAVGAALPKE